MSIPIPEFNNGLKFFWLISQKVMHHQAAKLAGVFRFYAVCGVGFGG